MIAIVRADPDDAPLLTDLAFRSKGYWGYPQRWLEHWRQILEVTPNVIERYPLFKAIDSNGTLVGCYGLTGQGPVRTLYGFWVAPEAMGKGVGRALFAHMIETARKEGAEVVEWDSDPNAAPFYLRMGARHVGHSITLLEGSRRVLPLFRLRLIRS